MFLIFLNFRISENFRKFQVICKTMQNDTWKNKIKSVKPPNKSKSSTWEIKIREKKVTLLTRVRANFTTAATLTFKRQRAKTNFFPHVFGNFFEALTIFSQFFS